VTAFEPLGSLRVLSDHGVQFVVIGGVAGVTHGSPSVTQDLDVCYERSPENLERLASALASIHARLRGTDDDVAFSLDAKTLAAGDHFTFITDLGDLDCLGIPAGTLGYDDLVKDAIDIDLDGLVVSVSSLDDLIRMKRAAGRPRDLAELEILGALREESTKG
jgi:predicted nucleotidyltransferase